MKLLTITLLAGLTLSACATANATPPPGTVKYASGGGHWVLNPNKCPDLVEDRRQRRAMRRDEAYDRSRRDVIEDWTERKNARRDEAVTNCPARAWEWHGPRYRKSYHPARPVKVNVYFHPTKRAYYRRHGHKRVVIRF